MIPFQDHSQEYSMAYDGRNNKLRRQEAVGMDELVSQFIREMKLSSGLNRQRAAEAWAAVSGASRYTLDVSFDRGIMICAISSSVVRNQLYFQRDVLVRKMNEYLDNDELLVRDAKAGPVVRELILR